MGLSVVLVTERGESLGEVHDPRNLLHQLLPSNEDSSYQCLRFVDWYGDTVFNVLQMGTVLDELHRLNAAAETEEKQLLLSAIEGLVRRCRDEPHLYLKFCGD